MNIKIENGHDHIEDIKMLFTEHLEALGFDLTTADIRNEFASLPDKYRKPNERLYILYVNDVPAGCAALYHRFGAKGSLKRLYVRPPYRYKGLGAKLSNLIVDDAIALGYDELLVDALHSDKVSVEFCDHLGFHRPESPSGVKPDKALFLVKKLKK